MRNENCTACVLHETTSHVCVMGNGLPESRIMLVGEAPGADEEKEGVPFCGRAGQLLNECLDEIGISRDLIYVTNVVKCRPPSNRKPDKEEIRACQQYLEREFALVSPQAVLLLGNTALEAFTGEAGITKKRGKRLLDNPFIMATYHPSYILRNPIERTTFVKDIRTLLDNVSIV